MQWLHDDEPTEDWDNHLQSHRISHKYLLNDPQHQQVAVPIHDDR